MASYESLIGNFASIQMLGEAIAKSGMFGPITQNIGVVIATECYLSDMAPLEYLKRNKLVNGKPFKQYDAMLAEFHERGGDSKIVSKTSDLASIELTYKGKTETFSLSWQDAQHEVYPYLGKESDIVAALARGETPPLKPKYATPGSRATMLFARVVSSSIRAKCPEVNFGVYTLEELEDLPGEGQGQRSESVAVPASKPIVSDAPKVDAEVVEVVAISHPLLGADEPGTDGPDPISDELVQKLLGRCQVINQMHPDFTRKLKAKLIDSGVTDGKLKNLTQFEGEQLLVALDTREAGDVIEMSLRSKSKS